MKASDETVDEGLRERVRMPELTEDELCGRDRRGWQRRRIMSELMCHVSWLPKMVPRYLLESTVSRASPWRAVDCVRLVQRSFLCL